LNRSVSRIRLRLGVEGWRRPAGPLYGPGHGLLLQILRSVSSEASAALHDANTRKPFALSPLTIDVRSDSVAEAVLVVNVWDVALSELLRAALEAALDLRVTVGGAAAVIVDVTTEPPVRLDALAPTSAPPSVRVRFESPTFFSLGRRFGHQQYGLLPIPELVTYSWLRAWQSAGGPVPASFDALALKERVALWGVHGLRTQVVRGEKTALTGFTGEALYAWVGEEPWGSGFLTTLARFAEYCGTGAKTGHGFGRTRICDGPASARALS
jgi:CRISPR-associated endoribonuclease Cas6